MNHEVETIATLNERIDELDSMNRNHADYIARLESRIAKLTAAASSVSPAVERPISWKPSEIEGIPAEGRFLSARQIQQVMDALEVGGESWRCDAFEMIQGLYEPPAAVERPSEPAKLIAAWREESTEIERETGDRFDRASCAFLRCAHELEAAITAAGSPPSRVRERVLIFEVEPVTEVSDVQLRQPEEVSQMRRLQMPKHEHLSQRAVSAQEIDLAIATAIGDGASPDAVEAIQAARAAVSDRQQQLGAAGPPAALLREPWQKLRPLIAEVWGSHRDRKSPDYNRCDVSECAWCQWTREAVEQITDVLTLKADPPKEPQP